MAEPDNQNNHNATDDDGYLRACEGILRAKFGRHHYNVTAKAIEQLKFDEQNGLTRTAKTLSPSWGEIVLLLQRAWLSWAAAFTLLMIAALFFLFSRSGTTEKAQIDRLLNDSRKNARAESTRTLIEDAYAALERREYDRAEALFGQVLGQLSTNAEAHYGLGEALRAKKDFNKAEPHLREAIRLTPDAASAYLSLGSLLHAKGESAEAERLSRKALALNPNDIAGYIALAGILTDKPEALSEAESWYQKALARKPDSADALSGLALVQLRLGNAAGAETLLRKAIALSPGSSRFQNNLGEALRALGRIDEAEQMFQEAIRLDPDNVAPYGNLAILYATRRNFAEAEKMFRDVLSRSPANDRLRALVNLAMVCGELGKVEEAEGFFRQALNLSPDEPRIQEPFAAFLADYNLKLDEALDLASRAVQRLPDSPDTLDTLGWVQLKRGSLSESEITLRKALLLAGDRPVAAKIREHLQKLEESQKK